jgi:hypothetical protein
MRNGIAQFRAYKQVIGLTGYICIVTNAAAGTINGIDDPNRVPGRFIVVLKRDHIISLRNPVLTDAREAAGSSENWLAAKAAADAEVAQMVANLKKSHPKVKISAVMSQGQLPRFVLKASDEDAKAIADEDDVAEVDADSSRGSIKNVTSRDHSENGKTHSTVASAEHLN